MSCKYHSLYSPYISWKRLNFQSFSNSLLWHSDIIFAHRKNLFLLKTKTHVVELMFYLSTVSTFLPWIKDFYSFFTFFATLDLIWPKFCPKITHSLSLFAGLQWNVLRDLIHSINNFNCNPVVLKTKLVKPLKITIFGSNLCKKGVTMDHAQKKKQFF